MGKKDYFPYWNLFWNMTRVEFKLRDQGTLLGFLWTLLHPALIFIVLYILFIKWLGHFIDQYAAYLIIGLLFWNFFHKATCLGLATFKRRALLMRNYKFPREIMVFSTVAAVFVSTALEIAVLVPLLWLWGVKPNWAWTLLPLWALFLLSITMGVSLLLAILAAQFHDMERIWDVISTALFYLTPVFYPLNILSDRNKALLSASPLTMIINGIRDCLISGLFPDPKICWLLAGLSALCLGAGLFLMRRYEHRIADMIIS
ncbi:MAG: hypothetical protein A3J74_00170 [Elusimicrobia bacterium RIFCSPHIGHO2_02_FULL_57_9]|nr:MAG: hypothetical protein A3J74_00170 [Elusimicrobia bacterium RIFCSPHIGHO2_02_FULL_57_9]